MTACPACGHSVAMHRSNISTQTGERPGDPCPCYALVGGAACGCTEALP